jgi:hypothetical protein
MYFSSQVSSLCAFRAAMELFQRANEDLLRATEAVSEGDILSAAISIQQAKTAAKSGAAVAKVAKEVNETLLDVLA